jgi:hypothetical protein
MSGIKLALLPAQMKNSSTLHAADFMVLDSVSEGDDGAIMKVPAPMLKIHQKSSWHHCQQQG